MTMHEIQAELNDISNVLLGMSKVFQDERYPSAAISLADMAHRLKDISANELEVFEVIGED